METCCKLSADPKFAYKITGDFSWHDLENSFSKFLTIQDDQKKISSSIEPSYGKVISKIEMDCISSGSYLNEIANMASGKGLTKCATFPSSGRILSSAESINGDADGKDDLTAEVLAPINHPESTNKAVQLSKSLPTPLKLVSAMKGSRGKEGASPRKLSVTWAPDVYDPPPSTVLNVSIGNMPWHKKNSRKIVRNKHKVSGKSSRSSKGKKDKKHARKYTVSFNRYLKSEDEDKLVDCNGSRHNLVDSDDSSRDPFCVSGFLGRPVMKLQFPVA